MEQNDLPFAPFKQVVVIRKDLNMRKGKLVAQGSHACMADLLQKWLAGVKKEDLNEAEREYYLVHFRKICLYVNSEEELDAIYANAKLAGLIVHMIVDSGLTEFKGVKTKTCLAIGPNADAEIDKITGHLPLY